MQSTFAANYLEEVKTNDPTFSTNDYGDSDTGSGNNEAADEDPINRAWV
ncbi:MAG: hypothetical protein ACRELG_21510 [Gemmataceae bacterium]